MTRTRYRLRCTFAAVAALAAALAGWRHRHAARPPRRPPPVAAASAPLPPELEAIRAAEAIKIYGDSDDRPLAERKTGLISLGDSEISGEGVGTYDPATNGPAN